MKKIITLIFVLFTSLYSENIYFSQNSLNTKEIEAKIISKIASDLLTNPKVYIIGDNEELGKFFTENIEIASNCNDANFIYIKKNSNFDINECHNKNIIFFTDDKYEFKENKYIFGAFFWLKSRPNVRISSNKAKELDISIPASYLKFVDEK